MTKRLLFIFLLAASAAILSAQTANINTTVAQFQQGITAAMNGGDLRKARDLANQMSSALTQQLVLLAPTQQQRLEQLETSYAGSSGRAHFRWLVRLPRAAFDAGQFSKAAAYVDDLLQMAPNYSTDVATGDAYFEAYTVRGRLCVSNNDVSCAKQALLASIEQAKPSPMLTNLGPYMGLARDLLALGQRDVVLQFLTECKPIWTQDRGALDHWIAEIRGGGDPILKSRLNN